MNNEIEEIYINKAVSTNNIASSVAKKYHYQGKIIGKLIASIYWDITVCEVNHTKYEGAYLPESKRQKIKQLKKEIKKLELLISEYIINLAKKKEIIALGYTSEEEKSLQVIPVKEWDCLYLDIHNEQASDKLLRYSKVKFIYKNDLSSEEKLILVGHEKPTAEDKPTKLTAKEASKKALDKKYKNDREAKKNLYSEYNKMPEDKKKIPKVVLSHLYPIYEQYYEKITKKDKKARNESTIIKWIREYKNGKYPK